MSSPVFEFTADHKEQFLRDGYLILPGFFSTSEAAALKQHADVLLRDFSLDGHPLTRFVAGDTLGDADSATAAIESKRVNDAYFLDSATKVSYFFEQGAFDSQTGALTVPKERAVNKVGHALHELDQVFKEFTFAPRVLSVVNGLGLFEDPRCLQSMLIFKHPRIGGSVPGHQDSTFLYTNPLSAVGLWFALEDCTKTNGCLEFVPGSHKVKPITTRMIRKRDGSVGTEFVEVEPQPNEPPASDVVYEDKDYVVAEVPAGTLVLIHGSIVHRSAPNLSDKSRYIYTFHMIEGAAE
ncbi:phytanoyl-CoA dioxygenase, partial [Ramicandelaber brevisporus]